MLFYDLCYFMKIWYFMLYKIFIYKILKNYIYTTIAVLDL